jgi:hypothetical protein
MRISTSILAILVIFSVAFSSEAQINPPKKHAWNVGLFTGLGGLNFTPIPGIDGQYKGTIVRGVIGYKVLGAGVTQEVARISPVFYNGFFVLSAYYAQGQEESVTGFSGTADFKRYIGMAGVRFYFGSRFYSSFQGGVMVSSYTGHSDKNETIPYFEFNIGINLFRNFLPREIPSE